MVRTQRCSPAPQWGDEGTEEGPPCPPVGGGMRAQRKAPLAPQRGDEDTERKKQCEHIIKP